MTLPDERYHAVLSAERFLLDLLIPARTPRVPRAVREQARRILHHFPLEWHMAVVAERVPDVFAAELEDLQRFVLKGRESLDGGGES